MSTALSLLAFNPLIEPNNKNCVFMRASNPKWGKMWQTERNWCFLEESYKSLLFIGDFDIDNLRVMSNLLIQLAGLQYFIWCPYCSLDYTLFSPSYFFLFNLTSFDFLLLRNPLSLFLFYSLSSFSSTFSFVSVVIFLFLSRYILSRLALIFCHFSSLYLFWSFT